MKFSIHFQFLGRASVWNDRSCFLPKFQLVLAEQYQKPLPSEQLQAKVCSKRAPVLHEKYKKLHGVPLRISSVT